jgi:hypothetical protein
VLNSARTGGTSALHDYLSKHPDVRLPNVSVMARAPATTTHHSAKEINFFTDEPWYRMGIGFYEEIISPQEQSPHYHVCLQVLLLRSKHKQVIDGSPSTTACPFALRRIKLAYGSHPMRFIVLLREPIDRFVSVSWPNGST